MVDKNCLSYWFPRLVQLSIPTPNTTIIHTDCELDLLLNGDTPGCLNDLVVQVREAAKILGLPAFLRTGHTSGKHNWLNTCYLENLYNIEDHIFALVEYSAMVDVIGLPTNVWVVREYMTPMVGFHAFEGMPVTREFRYFIRDGQIDGVQPYWPADALEGHVIDHGDWKSVLKVLNTMVPSDRQILNKLTEKIAASFEGYWSVDWLWSLQRGWVCIDMADGDRSFRLSS